MLSNCFLLLLTACLWSPLLLLASRIHLRRPHLHHHSEAAKHQKQSQPEILGCDLLALSLRLSVPRHPNLLLLLPWMVALFSRLSSGHVMCWRGWSWLLTARQIPCCVHLGGSQTGALLALLSHRDDLVQDGSIEAAPIRLRGVAASSTFAFSQCSDFQVQFRLVERLCFDLLPKVFHFILQFLDLNPDLFIPFGQIAWVSPRLRQFDFQTLQIMRPCSCIFSCCGNVSFRLCSICASSCCYILEVLTLAQLHRDLCWSHLQLFTTVCFANHFHVAVLIRFCVVAWILTLHGWLLTFTFFSKKKYSRNSSNSVSFSHWASYASIWSSPSPEDDDANQLRPFLADTACKWFPRNPVGMSVLHLRRVALDHTLVSEQKRQHGVEFQSQPTLGPHAALASSNVRCFFHTSHNGIFSWPHTTPVRCYSASTFQSASV